jgi:hypothetical protein
MSTQPITQQVQWQDLKVRSELDIVLEIAHQEGWKDCEIFGYGDMIIQPQESMGWELIPADLYKYSIPAEGIGRVHQIINAGIRIQGIIIADDERSTELPLTPTKPAFSLPPVKTIVSFIGKVLLKFICVAGVIAFVSLIALSLIYLAPLIILVSLVGTGGTVVYDPKLVILVDDGNGGTVWVSLFTWYD